MLDHGHDQTLAVGERDRDAEVDELPRHDRLAADLGVHPRIVLERVDRRAGDEGEIGRVDAVALLVLAPSDARGSRPPSTCRPRSRSSRGPRCRASGACAPSRRAASRSSARRSRRRRALLAAAGGGASGVRRRGSRAGAAGGCRGERGAAVTAGSAATRLPAPAREPAARRVGAGSAAGVAAPDSMKARMSFLVTRPPVPVPGTRPGSTPCSAAIRATTGETNVLPFLRCLRPGAVRRRRARRRRVGRPATSVRRGTGRRRRFGGDRRLGLRSGSGGAGVGSGSARRRRPARSARARCRRRRSRPPRPGSGRRRPHRGSAPPCRPCPWRSRAAARRARPCSPACFSHLVTVPSETDTPICGITTSVWVPVATVSSS